MQRLAEVIRSAYKLNGDTTPIATNTDMGVQPREHDNTLCVICHYSKKCVARWKNLTWCGGCSAERWPNSTYIGPIGEMSL